MTWTDDDTRRLAGCVPRERDAVHGEYLCVHAAKVYGDVDLVRHWADVRELLADLDWLRSETVELRRRNSEHVKKIVELGRLDIDAVLAPVRRVLAHCESRVSFHDKERDAMVLRGLFGDAHWHDAGHSQANTIANKLSLAIAEAKEIAGKEPEHR